MTDYTIRRATEDDLDAIARINAEVFLGDRESPETAREWVACWLRAYPLYQYFVAERNGEVLGYAGWQLHGGFRRAEPCFELDQIGVAQDAQGLGIGNRLVRENMRTLVDWCIAHDNRIESHVSFVVWAYALNFNAIDVYRREFSEGVDGMRRQFGERAEVMLRRRYPMTRPVRA